MDGRHLLFHAGQAVIPTASRAHDLQVDALIIQVRNVLYDDTAWHRWLLQLVSRMGLHTHYAPFFHLWETEYLTDVQAGRREYWGALEEFLFSVGLSRAQIQEVRAAGRGRRLQFSQHIRPFPGVVNTLLRLSGGGVTLIGWTGCEDADDAGERLRSWGLLEQFQSIQVGEPPSWDAPKSRYNDCLRQAQLPPDRVGILSSHPLELEAGRRAGLRTIAFNTCPSTPADRHLDQFADLPECVTVRPWKRAG